GLPESPERHDAWLLANDRLGLTVELRAAGGFFFQAEDGIRDRNVTGVQTCALPILAGLHLRPTHIRHNGAMAGIQINFTPFAPRALFGMPAAEFAHRTYDLVEVSRTVAAELHERVNSART